MTGDDDNPQAQLSGGALPKEIGANDLANLFGLTRQRINQLTAEGLPKAGRGRYLLKESVTWWVDYWKNKNSRADQSLDNHKRRLLIAQAKRAEIDNEQKLKELIPVDIVSNVLNQVGVIVASQLDAIAPRLSNELTNQDDPAYVKETIESETRQIRISIANLFDDIGINQNSGDDSKTTADKNG